MFELTATDKLNATIKVVGIGGAGGNIVNGLVGADLPSVELVAINTDAVALNELAVKHKIQIGTKVTKGLGAGADPIIGQEAAEVDSETIAETLLGADLVILIAGMGGGTGTGATPIVARLAKELGALTVAMVNRPFSMEGSKRAKTAAAGIDDLLKHVDALVTLPNESILRDVSNNTTLLEAFQIVDDAITQATSAIIELIVKPGLINIDFADIRTVLAEGGLAAVGVGSAESDGRANAAAKAAISSSFFDEADLSRAHAVLVNVTAGHDLSIGEFQEVATTVREHFSDEASVVVGTVIRAENTSQIHVTVIAIGLDDQTILDRLGKRTSEHAFDVSPARPLKIPTETKIDEADDYQVETELHDIPAFLRRQADDQPRKFMEQTNSLRIVASEHVSHEEVADLIVLLSDVYESVSTDRLKIRRVTNLPPGSGRKAEVQSSRNRSVQ